MFDRCGYCGLKKGMFPEGHLYCSEAFRHALQILNTEIQDYEELDKLIVEKLIEKVAEDYKLKYKVE